MSGSNRRRKLLKSRRPGGKIPLEEVDRRLIAVQELMIRGVDSRTIQRTLADKFNVVERTIRGYQQDVRQAIAADSGEMDLLFERGKARAQLDDLYMEARHRGDFKACVNILRLRLQTLPGGIAPAELQLTGPGGGPLQVAAVADVAVDKLTDEQLRSLRGIAETLAEVPLPGSDRKDRG